MKLKNTLSPEEYKSIKESYFHIYHYFLDSAPLDKAHITCLFKWGIQLNVSEEEILYIDDEKNIKFMKKTDRLEHLYNLVFMIFLDGVVEDIELKVVSEYAEKIGFKSHIVNDLLKTIVTAPYDGFNYKEVKKQVKEILEVSG
jgi:hypothetical protein